MIKNPPPSDRIDPFPPASLQPPDTTIRRPQGAEPPVCPPHKQAPLPPTGKLRPNYIADGEFGSLSTYAPTWKGDFTIPGLSKVDLAAGNVRIGRLLPPFWEPAADACKWPDQVLFVANLNFTDASDVARIARSFLVIGPNQLRDPALKQRVEMTELNVPARTVVNRFADKRMLPPEKDLLVQVDTAELKAFADGGNLNFYFKLEMDDGRVHYVNNEGRPNHNFTLTQADLQPVGDA